MIRSIFLLSLLFCLPDLAVAETAGVINLTRHWVGFVALGLFVFAYVFVVLEEVTDLRKSKPMMLAAALIWAAIAVYYRGHGNPELVEMAIKKEVLDYGELLLFLIVSITYLNAMEERGVFDGVRVWLLRQGFGYRGLYWITGALAFLISGISNNMTTAMLMMAVVTTVARDNPRFIALSCVHMVVAVNAGGAYCPFGDITTLMVWQKRVVSFWEFFDLFLPSLVNYLVPALLMSLAVPRSRPEPVQSAASMKRGAIAIVLLFLVTIAIAVVFSNLLLLPAAVGMMAGLTLLKFYGYYLRVTHRDEPELPTDLLEEHDPEEDAAIRQHGRYDIFRNLARMEWDTLFFFYGVVLCVGGLGFIGYLGLTSQWLYGTLGATQANILVGVASALVDNIPVMFAILTMNPEQSLGQWLLVTLTAGVGGSLLSVGSAAGVALMGQARGCYSFAYHLKWSPVIALGYAASIACHLWLNGDLF